jgi:hypothetical protein
VQPGKTARHFESMQSGQPVGAVPVTACTEDLSKAASRTLVDDADWLWD